LGKVFEVTRIMLQINFIFKKKKYGSKNFNLVS
jgi:hypothetical protein